MHNVAAIDQPHPGAAVERRRDRRITELCLSVLDRGLVAADAGLQLRDQRFLCVDALPRRVVLGDQGRVAIEIELGVRQLRLVVSFGGASLVQLRLKGTRIDLRQNFALFDVLALGEVDLLQLAVDAYMNNDAVERRDIAEAVEKHWDIFQLRACGGDWNCRRRGGWRRLVRYPHLIPDAECAERQHDGPSKQSSRANHRRSRINRVNLRKRRKTKRRPSA